MYPILKAKNIPYGVSPYGSLSFCISALQQGGICIYRPGWPDCPPDMYVSEPRANARAFMQHAAGAAFVLKGSSNVWIEPTNECLSTPMPESQLVWWRDWMDEYIEQAEALDWPPLALPTLSPGNGDQMMFNIWKPVLIKLKEHGGLFSVHDYTFQSQTGLCVYDQWEAARHVLQHKYMLIAGYDVPFTITEAARQSGNAPVDMDDFICWLDKVRQESYIHSVWLWVGGFNPTWPNANLDGHYVEIANRLN